jgi:AcrR family transcriptional regulator
MSPSPSQFPPESIAAQCPDLLAELDLPAPPQQERSRLKRQKLLDAAMLLFHERGYEATSIEDIAKQAGVAVGGFYQHFRSKKQVLLVLMDGLLKLLDGLLPQLSTIESPLGVGDPIATLEPIVRTGLTVDWAHAGAYRAWREAIVRDPELSALNRRVTTWSMARLVVAMKEIQQLPNARQGVDIEMTAWVLDLMFWQLAGTPSDNLDAVVRVVTDLLVHALFKDEPG